MRVYSPLREPGPPSVRPAAEHFFVRPHQLLLPDRKVASKAARWGAGLSFLLLVIANGGLGRIHSQTLPVIVGEVGFLASWCVLATSGVPAVLRNRAAYARLKRLREFKQGFKHRAFKLTRRSPRAA